MNTSVSSGRTAWAGAAGLAVGLAVYALVDLAPTPAGLPGSAAAEGLATAAQRMDADAVPQQPPAAAADRAAVAVQATVPTASTLPVGAAGAALVPVTLTVPQQLRVGEQTELWVGVGATATAGEVAFTVRFDPNVLQARSGTPGEWVSGDGAPAGFAVEVPEAADQVRIRGTAAARRAGASGGAVAAVQFQAVAAGHTTVTITDLVVNDGQGHRLPVLLSAAAVPVTVDAAPPPAAASVEAGERTP